MLAVHGAADPIAPKAERDAFEAEMTEAGARWALLTFGDVVHAFTDPRREQCRAWRCTTRRPPATAMRSRTPIIADAFAGKL